MIKMNTYIKESLTLSMIKVTPGYKPDNMKDFIKSIQQIFNGVDELKNDRKIMN